MKNCLVLGSGRSGTSMMGGILHNAGYYMGDNLYEGRDGNPKGFFENAYINGINEYILSYYDAPFYRYLRDKTNKSTVYAPSRGQRWLMSIKNKKIICPENKIKKKILDAVNKNNFAYKDPRFSYTLAIWEKFIDKEVFMIVMFREPSKTVSSILKECRSTSYLKNMFINEKHAYQSWISNYSYILNNYNVNDSEKFMFIHYNQVLDGSCLNKLQKKLKCQLNDSFVDSKLSRSMVKDEKNVKAIDIYKRLCKLANYTV